MPMIDHMASPAGSPSQPELQLTVHGTDAEQHLRALNNWLALEDELRGHLKLRHCPITPGQMGGMLDVLAVALGSGGAGVVMAQSLSTWLTQRRADITVTVKAPDGREVTVDVHRARDPLAVVREIERLTTPPED